MELVNKCYINLTDIQIYYYDNLFEELLEKGNSYKNLITITNYIVTRVCSRNFLDDDGTEIKNKFGYFKSSMLNNINKLESYKENLWNDIDTVNDLEI